MNTKATKTNKSNPSAPTTPTGKKPIEVMEGDVYIKIMPNGPYLVYGNPTIKQEFIEPNDEGASWEYAAGEDFGTGEQGKPIALCRCGHSKHAPFCDGAHATSDFDGTETAPHEPIMKGAEAFEGPDYTLFDNELYCAFARFCDAYGRVWNLVEEGGDSANELAIREAFHCPAGRLMIKKNGESELLEPKLPKEISALEDPAAECSGPLYVKGRIRIEGADGKVYEIRNRQTLCRCGKSVNKPFCSGTHAQIKYQDGIKGRKKNT